MKYLWSFSDMYIEQGIVLGKEQGIVLGKEQGKETNILKFIRYRVKKNMSLLEIMEDLIDIFELMSQESDKYL